VDRLMRKYGMASTEPAAEPKKAAADEAAAPTEAPAEANA
jgi:hypothetical protein